MGLPFLLFVDMVYPIAQRKRVQEASVVNDYEDNSWAFVVIICLFA
jgi:hypothetical protein